MNNKINKDTPCVTVIIPTRERADTLLYSLQTVVAQTYANLRIVISDNCSNDNTKDVVMSFNDERIEYYNSGKRLSMAHNWEFALSKINEGFVTILGDDDGLLPCAIESAVNILNETGSKALMTEACYYNWPSQTGNAYGKLRVPLGRKLKVRKANVWLDKLMSGKVDISHLPTLYTGGFIHSSVIETIKNKSPGDEFYYSSIPDVYSAIAITSVIDSYVFLFEPLAVVGLSKNSTGASVLNEDKNKNSPANAFYSEPNIPFHSSIPMCENGRIPSSDQVYKYESYLQSSFLRDDKNVISDEEQLKVVLSLSKGQHPSVRDWCKQFSDMHGIDFNRMKKLSFFYNLYLRLESIPARLKYELNQYIFETPKLPIVNVCEAIVAVATLRQYSLGQRISRLFKLAGKLKKLISY
ncbi:MAG: glycosyltransferase [Gammaproteobacteria bacterium]|nr:glycosyltransferase [Gammaproteobacteria bacterium]